MKMVAAVMEDKVDELLTVLDKDIQHIQDSLHQLNELRGLVIKRDDAALAKLLGTIRAKADSYAANESKRQLIRKDLANALGLAVEQMTLSRLETALSNGRKAQVANKKAELQSLINKLRQEHLSTAMLLSECARFNNLLLRSIFDLGQTRTLTYRANGATKWQTDKTFVNLHF
jgi:flagellar biosynthesis/type III secretory pathway chaperone